jgi:hypothetical protein
MTRYFAFTAMILGITLLMAYAADSLVIRYKIAKSREPFASVTVRQYYAIEKKANKTEFVFAGAQDLSCVNSLFPHLGRRPCWYVERHAEQRVNI